MEKYPKYSKRFKIKCFDLTCEFVLMSLLMLMKMFFFNSFVFTYILSALN